MKMVVRLHRNFTKTIVEILFGQIKNNNMTKKQVIIKSIKNTLGVEGCFSVGELDGEDQSITIGTLGNYVGLIEYFTEDYVEVNVYEPRSTSSDAIDSYTLFYEDLEEDILGDVLLLCEQWEAQNIKTEKRISD
jgi:hypothetical protein